MISKNFIKNSRKYFVFFTFLIIGLLIYKDYGFNIDEKFHRSNGFYWLKYLSNFFNLDYLQIVSEEKLNSIKGFTLSDINYYNKYGIIFDVPAALLEVILKIDEPLYFYQLRHILVFLYFFMGLIFFYKILFRRFKTDTIALLGVILLFITPRIFGDSFQNTKDIIFLTFVIISTYFFFESIDKEKYRSLILFSIFSAIATSVRMFGIFLPFSFLLMQFILIRKKNYKKIIFNSSLFIITFFLFLILTWPLLWENTFENLKTYFELIPSYGSGKVFFLGTYYNSDLVPYTYLPTWILISTPILHLILFSYGFFILSKRLYGRLINLKVNSSLNDFWRGKNESKDFVMLISFILILFGLIFFNLKLYNSWRIGYFLYFFIIYFAAFALYLILIKKRLNFRVQIFFKIILVIFFLLTIYRVFIYHPYQSYYFNILVPKSIKNNVEVDYTGLSAIHFLNQIAEENQSKKLIKIGVASWYPIWRMLELVNKKEGIKIEIVENRKISTADFIYTNKISDVDKKFNKKYDIPSNFKKVKQLQIDGVIIYEAYQRN